MRTNSKIYNQLVNLALKTKDEFKARGIVLPTLSEDGQIKIGRFTISKNTDGYLILNNRKETIYSKINLPQTALIIANSLALGKVVNHSILDLDQRCGCSKFDELNYQRLAKTLIRKKDWDRYEAILIKQESAQEKAKSAQDEIFRSFEKLHHLR